MGKANIRETYKNIRLAMPYEDILLGSRAICQRLLEEIEFDWVKHLNAYRPIQGLKEVDISLFVSEIKAKQPQRAIGFVGPAKSQKLPAQKFDLILVPCLAFDKNNYRLGWGGGFYDRFLVRQPQALKIGVCFQNGFIESGLENEPHDIKLDKIITESEIY